MHRACATLLRDKSRGKLITADHAHTIWELQSRTSGLAERPKLDIRGRNTVFWFQTWLQTFKPTGFNVPLVYPIEISHGQVLEVRFNAHFKGRLPGVNNMQVYGFFSPPDLSVLAYLELDHPTLVYDLRRNRTHLVDPAKRVNAQVLEQVWRGMTRQVIWGYDDARCHSCSFQDICNFDDALPYRLRSESKRQRVQQRIERIRNA